MSTITGTDNNDLLEGTLEDDGLAGGKGDDTLIGADGADTLNGGSGNDSMIGGPGDDVYRVSTRLDVVIEDADGGRDRVITPIAFTLPENVEDLYVTGPYGATGNSLANLIKLSIGDPGVTVFRLNGAAGNDTLVGGEGYDDLDGGSGDDLMVGGRGSDTYYVDSVGDRVRELASEGTDDVVSTLSYKLGRNVENLVLAGWAPINGTGNSLNNQIKGNEAANILRGGDGNDGLYGGGGADTLYGGRGHDFYDVESPLAVVKEAADAGIDRIRSSVDYRLPANVEDLDLILGAKKGIGNAMANRMEASDSGSLLDGKGGADTLVGSLGRDTFVYDPADTLLDGRESIDTIRIDGAGVVLDLTAIPNGVIKNMEAVNLKGHGDNTLVVDAQEILDMAPAYWQLSVFGNAGDMVIAHGAWADQGVSNWYHSYTLGDATLRIDTDVGVSLIA